MSKRQGIMHACVSRGGIYTGALLGEADGAYSHAALSGQSAANGDCLCPEIFSFS